MGYQAFSAVRDARRSDRFAARIAGRLLVDRQSFDVVIGDLSRGGAMLSGTALPDRGTEVILLADAMEVVATVIWSKGDTCGLNFHRPIEPLEVVRSVRRPTSDRAPAAPVLVGARRYVTRKVVSLR